MEERIRNVPEPNRECACINAAKREAQYQATKGDPAVITRDPAGGYKGPRRLLFELRGKTVVRDGVFMPGTDGLPLADSNVGIKQMAKDTFLQLEKYRAKVAQLEKLVALRQKKLLALPGRLGFRTVRDLIEALAAVSGADGPLKKAKNKRRKRAKITPVVRAKVKKLVAQGKTGAAIASEVGISVPSVQNIKKKLGLVRVAS